jgi:serine phosphatase RsbU (regulator of sigma subunit)
MAPWSKSANGAFFGSERLADFLVRSSHDHAPVAETTRRLSAAVVAYVGRELKDDATLLLIEYRGQGEGQGELPVMLSGLRD